MAAIARNQRKAILLETDNSDVTQAVFTLEPAGYGNLISQRQSSTTNYYLFDALGSARKLTSGMAAVTDSYDYRAYGETSASTGSTVNPFRWVGMLGYYYDIDRLAYYLRARPYSPKLARFLAEDPIAPLIEWNFYSYVVNSPLLGIDPTGLAGVDPAGQCCKNPIPYWKDNLYRSATECMVHILLMVALRPGGAFFGLGSGTAAAIRQAVERALKTGNWGSLLGCVKK